ncbi:MAG: transglycosylase domain-containing protein [Gemmatimonadota bacterium]|nr:transglycosylase domain-containing protein [Gemmatimonadota bacterium]
MMAGFSFRTMLMILIPAALAATAIGVVFNGYSSELDDLLGSRPASPAAANLPPILMRVADAMSTADLAGLLAEQFVRAGGPGPSGWLRRNCYPFLITLKFEKESLLAFFFDRTPFAFPRMTPVRGFERAALAYFGVPAARLTTGEAILLFHIARFPDAPLPVNDPERALELRDGLLQELFNDRLITRAQFRTESSRPLILSGSHPAVW